MASLLLLEVYAREALVNEYYREAFQHGIPLNAFEFFATKIFNEWGAHALEVHTQEAKAWRQLHNNMKAIIRVTVVGLGPMRRALRTAIARWKSRRVLLKRRWQRLTAQELQVEAEILYEERMAFDVLCRQGLMIQESILRSYLWGDYTDEWSDFAVLCTSVDRDSDLRCYLADCVESHKVLIQEMSATELHSLVLGPLALERIILEEVSARLRRGSSLGQEHRRLLSRTWYTLMEHARRDIESLECAERIEIHYLMKRN